MEIGHPREFENSTHRIRARARMERSLRNDGEDSFRGEMFLMLRNNSSRKLSWYLLSNAIWK